MKAPALAPKIALPELARRWGWTAGRLYRLCALNRIPHVRIGRDIFFEEHALGAWLEQQRKGPRTEQIATGARNRSRADECAALGIEPEHEFS